VALATLADIAANALRTNIGSVQGGGGGLLGALAGAVGGLFGAPGRATGGAVSGGRPYMVGERGPELFVPRMSGGIVPNNAMGGSTINAKRGTNLIYAVEHHRRVARGGDWPAVVVGEKAEVIGLQRAACQLQRFAKLAAPCLAHH
jgi:hypothetical protein